MTDLAQSIRDAIEALKTPAPRELVAEQLQRALEDAPVRQCYPEADGMRRLNLDGLARAIWDKRPDGGQMKKPWPLDGLSPKEQRGVRHDMPAAMELCYIYARAVVDALGLNARLSIKDLTPNAVTIAALEESAPAAGASDNIGQRDPVEMPDSTGADTAPHLGPIAQRPTHPMELSDLLTNFKIGDSTLRDILWAWQEPEYPSVQEVLHAQQFAADQIDAIASAVLALTSTEGK